MDEQVCKFSCPECHQHLSATSDLWGTDAICPTCGAAFIVKTPAAPPIPLPGTPEERTAKLAEQIRALGYEFTLPAGLPENMEAQELEEALDAFVFDHDDGFELALQDLENDEKTIYGKRPTELQVREIGRRYLAACLSGKYEGDFDLLRKIILNVAPALRA